VAEPDKKVLGGRHQNKLKYINPIATTHLSCNKPKINHSKLKLHDL